MARTFCLLNSCVKQKRYRDLSSVSIVMTGNRRRLANAFHGMRVVIWHHHERTTGARALFRRIRFDITRLYFTLLSDRAKERHILAYKARKFLTWRYKRIMRGVPQFEHGVDVDSVYLDRYALQGSIARVQCLLMVFGHLRLFLRQGRKTSLLAARIFRGLLAHTFYLLKIRVQRCKYLDRACTTIIFRRAGLLLHDFFGMWSSAAYQYHRLHHQYRVAVEAMMPKCLRRVFKSWLKHFQNKRLLLDREMLLSRVTHKGIIRRALAALHDISKFNLWMCSVMQVSGERRKRNLLLVAMMKWHDSSKYERWVGTILRLSADKQQQALLRGMMVVWHNFWRYRRWIRSIITTSSKTLDNSMLNKSMSTWVDLFKYDQWICTMEKASRFKLVGEHFQVWQDLVRYIVWLRSLMNTCFVYLKARTQRDCLREWSRFSCRSRWLEVAETKLQMRSSSKAEAVFFTAWAHSTLDVSVLMNGGGGVLAKRFSTRSRMHRTLHAWLRTFRDTLRCSLLFEIRNDALRFANMRRAAFEAWLEWHDLELECIDQESKNQKQLTLSKEQEDNRSRQLQQEEEQKTAQRIREQQESQKKFQIETQNRERHVQMLALQGWRRSQLSTLYRTFSAFCLHMQSRLSVGRKVLGILQTVLFHQLTCCFRLWRDLTHDELVHGAQTRLAHKLICRTLQRKGFLTLVHRWQRMRRLHYNSVKVVLRWTHLEIAGCWKVWHAIAIERKFLQRRGKAVLVRWNRLRIASAFATFCHFFGYILEEIRLRQVAEPYVRRSHLSNIRLFFLKWSRWNWRRHVL